MENAKAVDTKPRLTPQQTTELLMQRYGVTVTEVSTLPSFVDQNLLVVDKDGTKYILKLINSEESKEATLLEVQTFAMSFLQQHGFPVQTAVPTTTGQRMSLEAIDCGHGCQEYLVRLFTYLPGSPISKVSSTPQLLYETGKMAARVDKILQEMEHPHLNVLQRENYKWSFSNVPGLEAFINLLDGDPLQEIVKSVIHQYKTYIVPKLSNFRKCINHADISDHNVLVQLDESGNHRISGILDFGDMISGYYVHELATSIMYIMLGHPKPIEVGGPILAGFESVLPLNETEKDCLYVLVLSRICQFLLLSRRTLILHPDNADYVIRKGDVVALRQLWELGKEKVEEVWFKSAAQFSDEK